MADREHQEEIVAQGRPVGGIAVSAVALVGLLYIVVTGGNTGDQALPAPTEPTTATPTTAAPTTTSETAGQRSSAVIPLGSASTPTVGGSLADGAEFLVYERMPGVLCAIIDEGTPASATDSTEICHHELVTGSGAAVIDARLTFGYLPPGSASASLRYRTNGTGNDGIRVEQHAQFFALPIIGNDPYRLQYRTSTFAITEEVPLVAWSGGRAQSQTDVMAQGIPSSIAELPFNRRVDVIEEWTRFSEGPYVWSTLPTPSIEPGWGEFLQLDATGTEIVRSVPFPNVRLNAILGTRDALYLIGQQVVTPDQIAVDRGEVRFPIVVARIERPADPTSDPTNARATIRVFPQAAVGEEPALAPDVDRPGWELGPELPPVDSFAIGGVGGFIQIEGDGKTGSRILLDPVTLLPAEA